jgi:hypothetical protein
MIELFSLNIIRVRSLIGLEDVAIDQFIVLMSRGIQRVIPSIGIRWKAIEKDSPQDRCEMASIQLPIENLPTHRFWLKCLEEIVEFKSTMEKVKKLLP